MPAILPFLPLIIAGVTTGVGAYESNDASINQRAAQAANAKALLQQQQQQANQANLTKQEAVLGAQGQEQEQTGGSLTDSGTSALTDLLAGYPGYQSGSGGSGTTVSGGAASPSAASASASAIAPTSLSPGSAGGAPDIAAILAALRNGTGGGGFGNGSGGNISGGNWQQQPPQPQAWQELSNPVLA